MRRAFVLAAMMMAIGSAGCGGSPEPLPAREAQARASAFLDAWLAVDVDRAAGLADETLGGLLDFDVELQRKYRFRHVGTPVLDQPDCQRERMPGGDERVVGFRMVGRLRFDSGGYYRPVGTLCITVGPDGKVRATNYFGSEIRGKRLPRIWRD